MMRRISCLVLVPAALLAIVAGCEDAAPAKRTQKSRETIGKTTQNVLKLDEALANGGVLAATTITNTDYLDVNAQAYRTSVAKIAGMRVDQDMRLYEAEHNEYPKNYDEFMTFIIKKGNADGIQLPMLPYYQEYAYDEANKKLVTVEFPAKKEQFKKEQDKMLGR
jgi:hypothetical protein